jgi:hypothetical protein
MEGLLLEVAAKYRHERLYEYTIVIVKVFFAESNNNFSVRRFHLVGSGL